MNLRFEYLPYQRKFRKPLQTAHGLWGIREGILVRLEDSEGHYGFGEIAPVPWFGSETQAQALRWCREMGESVEQSELAPDSLPCCQFALYAARRQMAGPAFSRRFTVAALVDSPEILEERQAQGYATFKLKVGVAGFDTERPKIEECFRRLKRRQRLRLDANGGLSESDFASWLECLEGQAVEFLEQPLSPGLEHRTLEMSEPFSTPVALDESVSGRASLERWTSWPGPLVVKPGILGIPANTPPRQMLGSSVFETAFGCEAALQFLACHQNTDTAIGFDTLSWMEEDGWQIHPSGPQLAAGEVTAGQLQALWEEKKIL